MVRRKAESKGSRRAFEIADQQIEPGSLERIEIPVARLPAGVWLSLPVTVVHGRRSGPTVWLSAAVHGDELNGIPIIREVVDQLDPERVSGTLLAVPIVNVFGLVGESRYLPDRRDLNRAFPGSKRGSQAAQLAYLFMANVVERSDLGIDLHTGSDGRTNLPQVRCDLDDPEVARLARAFGAPVILHAPLRQGSLRAAAAGLGIKTLLYEAGEALRFDSTAIETGAVGTMRVLEAVGMIDGEVGRPAVEPTESRRSTWVRAGRGGLCQTRVQLGEYVEKKGPVAIVIDPTDGSGLIVRARTSGVVIGRLNDAVVNRGDGIVHIAEC